MDRRNAQGATIAHDFKARPKSLRPFLPTAPAPLPEVIDDDSEASWALWREATNAPSNWEADTVPMELRPEDPQD